MNVFKSRKGKAFAVVAAVVLVGAGGAIAATELISPSARQTAIIADAAGQLGVQPSALSGALTKAIENELNAEVTSGQISQAQASVLEARLAAGQLPLLGGFGFGHGGGFGHGFGGGFGGGGDLTTASTYLGLTTTQITTDLQGGQTLAQIANATSGKSADGLIQVLVDAAKTKLAAAVTAGTLTTAQEASSELNLQTQITNLVNGTGPAGGFGFGHGGGFGHGFGGGFGGGGDLTTASTYLGLTTTQITTDLQGGQTLAQIANATSGKSADGLIQVLVDAAKTKLAAAVTAGTLTTAQEASSELNLQTQITNLVNGTGPAGGFGFGFRHGFRGGGGGLFGPGGPGGGPAQTAPIPA